MTSVLASEWRPTPYSIPGGVVDATFPDAVGIVHDVAIVSGDLFDIASLRSADGTDSHDIAIRSGFHINIASVPNIADAGIDAWLSGTSVGLGWETVEPSDVNLVRGADDGISVIFGEMEYRSIGTATMALEELVERLDCSRYRGVGGTGVVQARYAMFDLHTVWDGAAHQGTYTSSIVCHRSDSGPEVAQDHVTTVDPALRISAQGKALKALLPRQGLYLFIVPPGTTALAIASRVAVAPDRSTSGGHWGPHGVCVRRIVLRDGDDWHDIPVDHPGLSQGWGPAERDGMELFRWTNGDAVLPLHDIPRATILELEIGMEIRYRMAPSTQ